jgi:SAM-dependent methyltransferase
MMFGLRETFRYVECGGCGYLRLLDVPSDLARHYPESYYSFRDVRMPRDSGTARAIRRVRSAIALRMPTPTVEWLVRSGALPGLFRWTAGVALRTSSAVADIGSGNGQILRFFERNGFSKLVGFDPYLTGDRVVGRGIRLHRAELGEIPDRYDLVMVHHAFEHMPDPVRTMTSLARLVSPRGALLIRTPVADSWAWRHYGVNWVQLDAPRHLHVHTARSIQHLATRSGLRICRSFRDSTGFQFWGSELCARDLALREYETRLSEVFSAEELEEFARRARELNAADTGDSACFVLRRAS